MGLANLVPGVSGGTMIVLMGLYDEFIGALADVTRLKLTRRNLTFLVLVGGMAATTIVCLAKSVGLLVSDHRSAMYALFVGMTLGGTPILTRMLGKWSRRSLTGLAIGMAIMMAIVFTKSEPPERETIRTAIAEGRFVIAPNYALDVSAGAVGMSAMILPGVSGAYMLLILGRYEVILAAIGAAKSFAFASGSVGDLGFLHILIPTACGAVLGVVVLSNLLKWMLRRHRDLMLGTLVGILLGSVVGIWPFHGDVLVADYLLGALLAVIGFAVTLLLSSVSD